MNTLRVRIALLLMTSIVAVVALITIATMYVFRAPDDDVIDLVAKQMILMERLARSDPENRELKVSPASGVIDENRTAIFKDATARLGSPLDVVVTTKKGQDSRRFQTASLRVGSRGWLIIDIDPPPDIELVWWLIFITIGVGGIGVLAANRMTRPLVLLESAVEMVKPDGVLPQIPEEGSAEVQATARALNMLSDRLKRAMESRMRLIAGAGHDFRTPLTRMRLRAEFVADNEDRALWLRDIAELDHIADSAIELVRLESTGTVPEVISLDELVGSVAAELREQNFQIDLSEIAEVRVSGNRIALKRALRNLLINAATHGERGSVGVSKGDTARITIRDDGPGIAPDMLQQVFEPFFRADPARSQHIPGAGLGLTISREIIRKAGGEIKISNGQDSGLVQIIDLPIAR